jgi:hypothetical protein
MPSPTTRLRLLKQAPGSNFDSWGTQLNAGALDLADEAFGVTTVAVAADVTLTSVNYLTDQSRKLVLVLTGAGGFTVTVPAVDKPYFIINNCAANVTVTPTGGTGAVVRAGTSAWWYCDGTDGFNPENTLDKIKTAAASVALGGNRLTGVGTATSATDAATLSNKVHEFATPTAPLAMGGQRITGVADPVDAQDATTKNWFDTTYSTLAGITADVVTVSGIAADVTTVAADGADIGTVAGISADVTTVAGISANVTTVAGISANVTSVAGNATNINAAAANETNINAAVANATNINAVVGNATNINTVAGIAADVTTAAGIAADITSVAGNAANINTVAGDTADINALGPISANITTVAGVAANVTTVAGLDTEVAALGPIAADITLAAANITDIQNAEENATAAAASAAAAALSASSLSTSISLANKAGLDPTLDIDFSDLAGVPADVVVSRASTATYFDEFGVLKSAAANVLRIDHDPLTGVPKGALIEEARTNLATHSEAFDNAVYGLNGATISANAATAPDGTTTADKLVENSSTGEHGLQHNGSISYTSGTTYTFTLFVEPNGRSDIRILLPSAAYGANQTVRFNLATGTATVISGTPTADITNIGGGRYRIRISAVATVTTTSLVAQIRLMDASGNVSYTGDGTSGLFLWGAQLEAGAFPTSYIPTTTGAATRAADAVSLATTGWYDAAGGTVFAEGGPGYIPTGSAIAALVSLDDGTSSERIQLRRSDATGGFASAIMVDGGVIQASLFFAGGSWADAVSRKLALAFAVNDVNFSVNGALATPDTSASLPTPTQIQIGNGADLAYLNGHIKRIAYWPARLANATIQSITT